jgi:hypothetical protein
VVKSCREPEPGAIWIKRFNHEEHEGTRRWRGSLFVSFVSFVVKSCREPEPGAIWLKRFNHEEHEGTRRWLVYLFVFFVSFVVKSCREPEPGAIWLKRFNREAHEGTRRWLVYLVRGPFWTATLWLATGAFRKFDPLAHFSLLLFVGETSSVHICDWAHRLLYTRSETEFRSTPGLNPTPSRFVPLWPFAVPLNQQEHGGQYVP